MGESAHWIPDIRLREGAWIQRRGIRLSFRVYCTVLDRVYLEHVSRFQGCLMAKQIMFGSDLFAPLLYEDPLDV